MKFFIVLLTFLLLSIQDVCASSVTMRISERPLFDFPSIRYVELGTFQNKKQPLAIPFQKQTGKLKTLDANKNVTDLLKANLFAYISNGTSWKIITPALFQGASPIKADAAKTMLITADISYVEEQINKAEQGYFVLFVKNTKNTVANVVSAYGAEAVGDALSREKQGFAVTIPYTESLHGVKVTFHLVRKSTGKPLAPQQTITLFYNHKWGGWTKSSLLPENIALRIRRYYRFDLQYDFFAMLLGRRSVANDRLSQFERIPKTNLEIEQQMLQRVAFLFAKKLVVVQTEQKVEIESGDSIAETLLENKAFNAAIGRLESLKKPLSKANLYNLALSYEANGDWQQSLSSYEEGAKRFPKEEKFTKALQRLAR